MRPGTGVGGRRAVSLLEIVLGALILGISGVTVLELVRSNTANLQLTEIEVIARGMGADLLERYARPSVHDFPSEQPATRIALGVPTKWDLVVEDPSMKYGFRREELASLLTQYDLTFTVDIKPREHASFGTGRRLTHVSVVARWLDISPSGQRSASGDYKEVTFDCLVDR